MAIFLKKMFLLEGKVNYKGKPMGNSKLLAFMLKKNLEESNVGSKQEDTNVNVLKENKMFVFSKFATVPIEIKE